MEVDETTLYRVVGERLKRLRQQTGITQAELADSVGVLRTSITNIESGRQKPPLHLLYGVCATLNVEFASILPANEEVDRDSADENVEGLGGPLPPRAAKFVKNLREG